MWHSFLPSLRLRRWRRQQYLLVVVVVAVVAQFAAIFGLGASMAAAPGLQVPRFRAVLWDVDGTLVASTNLGLEGTNAVMRRNSLPEISKAQYLEGCKYPTIERFGFHVSGNTGDPRGPALADEFDALYVTKVSGDTVPYYAGMGELLRDLQTAGCRLGALSNACGAYVRAVLAVHDLQDAFEAQLGFDDVPDGKPSPSGLLQICNKLGLEPNSCVYIGDAATDGQAAASAGMQGIGVCWGANPREKLEGAFPKVVSDMDELRSALLES